MTSLRRAALGLPAAIALVLSAFTLVELRAGQRALLACDAAIAARDVPVAIARARDAAFAFVPGSPYSRAGYERLEALARDAETRADTADAILAWSAMRAAATATSSPFGSNDAWRALADDGVTRAGSRPPVASAAAEVTPSEAMLRGSLSREDTPSPFRVRRPRLRQPRLPLRRCPASGHCAGRRVAAAREGRARHRRRGSRELRNRLTACLIAPARPIESGRTRSSAVSVAPRSSPPYCRARLRASRWRRIAWRRGRLDNRPPSRTSGHRWIRRCSRRGLRRANTARAGPPRSRSWS